MQKSEMTQVGRIFQNAERYGNKSKVKNRKSKLRNCRNENVKNQNCGIAASRDDFLNFALCTLHFAFISDFCPTNVYF